MSQSDRIISKLENHASMMQYLNQNYPDILKEWSNGPNKATTGHQTDLAEGEDSAT